MRRKHHRENLHLPFLPRSLATSYVSVFSNIPAMSLLKRRRTDFVRKELTDDEKAMYDLIRSKENIGIEKKFLKKELNTMKERAVTNSLKSLMEKQKIKEILTVQKKKVLMAMEIQPSSELTGGAWFSQGNLDTAFIENLMQCCLRIIRTQKVATVESISERIKLSKVFNVAVPADQIKEILKTLVLDSEITEVKSSGLGEYASVPTGMVCYKCTKKVQVMDAGASGRTTAMVSIPCGACPRITQCTPDGAISPITCEYYNKWLNF